MAIKQMLVSRGDLAEFLGLGMTTVASFIARGVFKPRKDHRFDLRDTVAKIIKSQGNRIGNRGADGAEDGKSLTEARIQHTLATTESVALKTSRQKGEVVLLEVVADIVDQRDNHHPGRRFCFPFHRPTTGRPFQLPRLRTN